MSERSYSATTAKHLSYARSAVSHLACINVPRYIIGERMRTGQYRGGDGVKEDHAANLEYLTGDLARIAKRAGLVKTRSRVEWAQEDAERAHKTLAAYLIFFGIRRKMPAMPSFAAALERAARIENPDPASLDKRERAAAQRAQAKYATARLREIDRELAPPRYTASAHRSNWRLFGAFMDDNYGYAGRYESPMLRVNGEDIETSLGARIPLAAAPMVWNLVQRAIGHGGFEPSHALGRLKLGDYPLDRIDADGTLRAGCHVIPYSELEVMARRLGL
jgi:hypothetical protein